MALNVLRANQLLLVVLGLLTTHAGGQDSSDVTATASARLSPDVDVFDDEAASSIKMMMSKLDSVLSQEQACPISDEAPTQPRTCLDLTTGQSIITQLCDRIIGLESRLDKLTSQAKRAFSYHNKKDATTSGHETKQTQDKRDKLDHGAEKKVDQRLPDPSKNDSNDHQGYNDHDNSSIIQHHLEEHVHYNNNNTSIRDELKAELVQLQQEIVLMKRSSMFYALAQQNITANLTRQPLQDFTVKVNKGRNFDPTSGVFTAPYDGVYHFSVSLQMSPYIPAEIHLVLNSDIIATSQDGQQPFLEVMTPLREHQQVWSELTSNPALSDSYMAVTFFGYFLH